jgi:hypothetical protein
MQDTDQDVHRSLLWLLETTLGSGEDGPGITFVADYDRFGEVVSQELVPDGASIMVRGRSVCACMYVCMCIYLQDRSAY